MKKHVATVSLSIFIAIIVTFISRHPITSEFVADIFPVSQVAAIGTILDANTNVVAWYKFNDSTGTSVSDSTTNKNNSIMSGQGTAWTTGNDGGALQFKGSGSFVALPSKLNAVPVTYSIWFNTTSGGSILSDSDQAPGSGVDPSIFSPFLMVRSDGKLAGGWGTGSSYPVKEITSISKVNDGMWHLAVVSNNGTTQSLYLDGALVGSEKAGALSSKYVQLGTGQSSHWDGGYYGWWSYTGFVDNLRIFNKALTSDEVSTLYSAQFSNAVTASSCQEGDVETAMQQVVVGGTLTIPAGAPGTCVWTRPFYISRPMTLQGQGIDITNITDAVDFNTTINSHAVFNLAAPAGALTRLTNMTVIANGSTDVYNKGMIRVSVHGPQWRVDHIRAIDSAAAVFEVNSSGGVIDHNTFDITGPHQVIRSFNGVNADSGGDFYGDVAWSQGYDLGSGTNSFFVEDNIFNQLDPTHYITSAADGETGQRVVFRHNTMNNMSWANHGLDSSGFLRGARSFEIYNNVFNYVTTSAPGSANGISLRSGNGVIFGNTFNGNAAPGTPIYTDNYRDWADFAPWGACDGTSPYDVNDVATYAAGVATAPSSAVGGTITFTDSSAKWTPHHWIGYSLHNTTIKGAGSIIVENTATTITLKNVDADANSGTHRTGGAIRWNQNDGYKILRASSCLDQTGRGHGVLFTRNANSLPTNTVSGQILEPTYVWGNSKNGASVGMVSASPHSVENTDFFNGVCPVGYVPYTYPHPLIGTPAQAQPLNCNGVATSQQPSINAITPAISPTPVTPPSSSSGGSVTNTVVPSSINQQPLTIVTNRPPAPYVTSTNTISSIRPRGTGKIFGSNRVADRTPPVISSINVGNITATTSVISWVTDKPASTFVRYGRRVSYIRGSGDDDDMLTIQHSIKLVGLRKSTSYYYRITSIDASGNRASSTDYSFTTLGPSAPVR